MRPALWTLAPFAAVALVHGAALLGTAAATVVALALFAPAAWYGVRQH